MEAGNPFRRMRILVCIGLLLNALFVASPLYRRAVLGTRDQDLAIHVRNVHEYALALREGQLPPLVAPALNDYQRLPVFQYYSGTAYLLPGVVGLSGLDAYSSLKVAIVCLSFLGALALFAVLRSAVGNGTAAYLGTMTFQLFGFGAVDLYNRGGYPEWASLHLAALVLWGLVRLADCCARHEPPRRLIARFALCALTLVLFIPCHPTQTIYTGLTVLILTAAYSLDRSSGKAFGRWLLLAGLAGLTGVLLTAWFWLPVFRDAAHLRIMGHLTYTYTSAAESAGLVFAAWFRTRGQPGWAPQLGPHITLAAILTALFAWRKTCRVQAVAVVVLLALFAFLILLPDFKEHSPRFQPVYSMILPWVKPMQFSYRFLIPAAVAGSVAVALALRHIEDLLWSTRWRAVLFAGGTVFLVAYSFPFYHRCGALDSPHHLPLAYVLSDSFDAHNVTLSYAMCGNDYRAYNREWMRDEALRTGTDMPLPFEGVPFETAVVLVDPQGTFDVFVNGRKAPTRAATDSETGRPVISFAVCPGRGMYGRSRVALRFESSAAPVRVEAMMFRPAGDKDWVRLPVLIDQSTDSPAATWRVRVRERGVYQLPFCFYPDVRVQVNGQPVEHVSADRYLFTTHLEAGERVIEVLPARAGMVLFGPGLAVLGLFTVGVLLRAGKWTKSSAITPLPVRPQPASEPAPEQLDRSRRAG
jgi:hypothetical protein